MSVERSAMGVTGLSWWFDGLNEGRDLHVVAGGNTRRLDQALWLERDPEDPVRADRAAPGHTVRFEARLAPVPTTGLGVLVDPETGVVSAALPLPSVYPANFIVTATVRQAAPPHGEWRHSIRVHVHPGVRRVWLTPPALTLRRRAPFPAPAAPTGAGPRFGILAVFEDDTVGDITCVGDIDWFSSDHDIVSFFAADPDDSHRATHVVGRLDPRGGVDARATITATLPARFAIRPRTGARLGATGTAIVKEPWTVGADLSLVKDSVPPGRADAKDVLFLSEGFLSGDRAAYEQLVQRAAHSLATSPRTRPFDLLQGAVRIWAAFLPSSERASSTLNEVRRAPAPRGAAEVGEEVQHATEPPHWPAVPAGPAEPWTLEQMAWAVGMPVPTDTVEDVDSKLPLWRQLYGPVRREHVEQTFVAWRDLFVRVLVNERDTAFGLSIGGRPRLENPEFHRQIMLNPLRTVRSDLDVFLGGLRFRGRPPVPNRWVSGGDCANLIFLLSAGSRQSGTTSDVVCAGLSDQRDILLEPFSFRGTTGPDLRPYPIPARLTWDFRADVLAHELGHAFSLGDEYWTEDRPPPNAFAAGNVAARNEIFRAGRLDPTRIKWAWPRVATIPGRPDLAKLAVVRSVRGNPASSGGLVRMVVDAGGTSRFSVGDVVRLRRRPLPFAHEPGTSRRMTIVDVFPQANEVEAQLIANDPETLPTAPIRRDYNPADYPAGSIVFAPVRGGATGPELLLVAPAILAHLGTTGGPFSVVPRGGGGNDRETPNRLPPAVTPNRPRFRDQIMGVLEGAGDLYQHGAFRPSGFCIMRRGWDGTVLRTAPFCHVCRYILVDALDPTKHGVIDNDYARNYPYP